MITDEQFRLQKMISEVLSDGRWRTSEQIKAYLEAANEWELSQALERLRSAGDVVQGRDGSLVLWRRVP